MRKQESTAGTCRWCGGAGSGPGSAPAPRPRHVPSGSLATLETPAPQPAASTWLFPRGTRVCLRDPEPGLTLIVVSRPSLKAHAAKWTHFGFKTGHLLTAMDLPPRWRTFPSPRNASCALRSESAPPPPRRQPLMEFTILLCFAQKGAQTKPHRTQWLVSGSSHVEYVLTIQRCHCPCLWFVPFHRWVFRRPQTPCVCLTRPAQCSTLGVHLCRCG